jgi:hypothetical protein
VVKIISGHDIEIFEREIPKYLLDDDIDYRLKISFTVKIKNKLSDNQDEERKIYKQIHNILLMEKPAFTECFMDYADLREEERGNITAVNILEIDDNVEDDIDEDVELVIDHYGYQKDKTEEVDEDEVDEDEVDE